MRKYGVVQAPWTLLVRSPLHCVALVRSPLRESSSMALLPIIHHPDHALYLADRVVLLGRSGARTGPATELLTDTELSALYGVPVSTLAYSHGGQPGRTIVVHYGRP